MALQQPLRDRLPLLVGNDLRRTVGRVAQDAHDQAVEVDDVEILECLGIHQAHEPCPYLRQVAQEGRQQDPLALRGLPRQPARTMQRHHGLPGPRTSADARGPGERGSGDRALRRVQVDHPLLDRSIEQALDLCRARGRDELGLRVVGSQPLGELVHLDDDILDARCATRTEELEMVGGALPQIRQQRHRIGVGKVIPENQPDVDHGRQAPQPRDQLGIHAGERQQLSVGERRERVGHHRRRPPRTAALRGPFARLSVARRITAARLDDPHPRALGRQPETVDALVDVLAQPDRHDEEATRCAQEHRAPVPHAEPVEVGMALELLDVEVRRVCPERRLAEGARQRVDGGRKLRRHLAGQVPRKRALLEVDLHVGTLASAFSRRPGPNPSSRTRATPTARRLASRGTSARETSDRTRIPSARSAP